MGIFVDYQTDVYSNLANVPQTILIAAANTIQVAAINICNLGNQDIRFSLKFHRVETSSTIEGFIIKNLLIGPYDTTNLINLKDLGIFLEYPGTITDSLICFSNGYSQKFDCVITYLVLNGV